MRLTFSVLVGLVGGLLFFGHAMVNNSHAWPLVWPALAGGLAVLLSRRGSHSTYGRDLAKAGVAGISAGVVFLGATAVALSNMGMFKSQSLLGLGIAAVLGLVAAMVIGGLAHPLAARRS